METTTFLIVFAALASGAIVVEMLVFIAIAIFTWWEEKQKRKNRKVRFT